MSSPTNPKLRPEKASVVGVVHSAAGLRAARKLKPGAVDFLEIRADAFAGGEQEILPLLPRLKFPLIVTVRDPREGGFNALPIALRRALFEQFLPHAAMIDIELASLKNLRAVAAQARARGVALILSHHDFRRTPTPARLAELAARAAREGADVFKVAALTSTAADLATLLSFLHRQKRLPVSVMGMGRFGKISRLLFAQAGSVLNYGFLGSANVAGQWPAPLLKTRIAELVSEDANEPV
jgi:3-dehydroquinate dehydratase I